MSSGESEGAYLSDWLDCRDFADDFDQEYREDAYNASISSMQARYRDNKRSQVGTTIRCACCSKRILKKSYQTQFCRNKGQGNCKDTYWNNTSDKRRLRAQFIAANR